MYWNKLLSVSHWTLAMGMLYAAVPSYFLMVATKKSPWILAFIFCLIIGVGLNLGQYFDNCCGPSGEMQGAEICSDYDLDYMFVYKSACVPGIVAVGKDGGDFNLQAFASRGYFRLLQPDVEAHVPIRAAKQLG